MIGLPASASQTNWRVLPDQPEAQTRLQSELGVSRLLAKLLVNRGITNPAEAEHFLNPSLDHLSDPTKLPDFEPALRAILGARERKEKIYIHGDYDVDGVSSTAILHRFLTKIDCNVVSHVPHREKEGYGIHSKAVHWATEAGAQLFLTCDCGSSAHNALEMVYEAGMKAVVTDHHEVQATLPQAEAIVNPHRHDGPWPGIELSGAGIAYQLCHGICRDLGLPEAMFHKNFMDLAVLGTVADVMPLHHDNRVITAFGLRSLRGTGKAGLKALLKVAQLDDPTKPLTTRHIGFQLGPRLNAVGRIDDADVALRLLLTNQDIEATELAEFLDTTNQERRERQKRILDEATEEIRNKGLDEKYVIVVAKEGWEKGIVGIVAGKVVEAFRRPAFVLAIEGGKASGSARSIPNFHLANAINLNRDILASGGGHAAAAGCSLVVENIREFAHRLDQHAREFLTEEDFIPVTTIDAEATLAEANLELLREISQLEPFGQANPEPVFLCRNLSILSLTPTRNPEHARVTLGSVGQTREAMAFGLGHQLAETPRDAKIDVVFTLEESTWNGRTQFKWLIRDFQISGS